MLTKLILIIFLGYLVNKIIVVPFRKEWRQLFKQEKPEPRSSASDDTRKSLIREEDVEDAEFRDIND